MKNKLFFAVLTLGVIFLLTTGCQEVPQAQLNLAQSAIDSARTLQSDRYLAAEFNSIQDSFNTAVANIEAMKSESFFKRNYKDAAAQLDMVKANADNVIANTTARKDAVKIEAESLITEITILVAENKVLILKAPKGKEGKAALDAIEQDNTAIESTLAEASTIIERGDYLTAKDKLNAAKVKALSIKDELQAAIDKYAKR